MNSFEKIYQIDPNRELYEGIEKHPYIEISDEEYLNLQKMKLDKIKELEEIENKILTMFNENVRQGKGDEKSKSKGSTKKFK